MKSFPHGGNLRRLSQASGRDISQLTDFSANINPLGPPAWLRPVISSAISSLVNYPDPDNSDFKQAVAKRYNAGLNETMVGNGSTELIYIVPRALDKKKAVIVAPSYADYLSACRQAGLETKIITTSAEQDFRLDVDQLDNRMEGDEIVFLGHPNNPTGMGVNRDSILDLAARHKDSFFVIDEAFLDLSSGIESFTKHRTPNIIVIISMTKTFAIPGVRIGCGIADASLVTKIEQYQLPWSVNTLAQMIGVKALSDEQYVSESVSLVATEREFLRSAISNMEGLSPFPGCANFILIRILDPKLDSGELVRRALGRGIAIRDCSNFEGLDNSYVRVAVRPREENELLIGVLKDILGKPSESKKHPKAKTLMFQGTSSSVGKSVLTAALCRLLTQEGFKVAPFKSQNMSLNSFVTQDGLEMGRAQVVQARACRQKPDVRMNPILLKPMSGIGSQVVVMGRPVANMSAEQYLDYRQTAFKSVCDAFDYLASNHEAVILEGAGSPAEVNLKNYDIVNMKMAQYAKSPVLIVGNIDRGGVFASFVGSMELLEEWERKLVSGFVINMFRGDPTLLDSALKYTLDFTGKPVLGVLPFIDSLGLPEEDSVSFKSGSFYDNKVSETDLEIAIIDLPHISNFTDFDAFRNEPDVSLRIVRSADELGRPDVIIIPGSKSVVNDLEYLKQNGLAGLIKNELGNKGAEIVGICGGLQMMGRWITDSHNLESGHLEMDGLGLLDLRTILETSKTTKFTKAVHLDSGIEVQGYEIHHGQTSSTSERALIVREDGVQVGFSGTDGMVWGTYLHGIFDSDLFRRWYLNRLRLRKGLETVVGTTAKYDLDSSLDQLADIARRSLDLKKIYEVMGL